MRLFTAMAIGLAIGVGIAVLVAAREIIEEEPTSITARAVTPGEPVRRERRHA